MMVLIVKSQTPVEAIEVLSFSVAPEHSDNCTCSSITATVCSAVQGGPSFMLVSTIVLGEHVQSYRE